jgi:hypothetical protein
VHSLRPMGSRRKHSTPFGLPFERSSSSLSGMSIGRHPSIQSVEMLDVSNISSVDRAIESNYSMNCQRTHSSENIAYDLRRMVSAEDCVQHLLMCRQFSNVSMGDRAPVIDSVETTDSIEEESDDDSYSNPDLSDLSPINGDSCDESVCPSTAVPNTPTRESTPVEMNYEYLDRTRPWEREDMQKLNTVPKGYTLPDPVDNTLSLGDLRVIGRYHVQKVANEFGKRLPAGMTNAELIDLAASLGLYPLIMRLHLEATERIPIRESHALYLEYKRESKLRAKSLKADKDVLLASHMRMLPEGRMTIDYFPGVALRLGRERDTIFRPLLHRVFREFKDEVKISLKQAGLNYSEMRKWRDPQLCTALYVCDSFVPGIWQTAVEVHFSKTKDFA